MKSMAFFTLPLSDPLSLFTLVLLLLLLVPLLMDKLGLPSMVGLLLVGILIGPKALNIAQRSGLIELLGKIGAVYLLFLTGLELDIGALRKNRGKGFYASLLTSLLPLAGGIALGMIFLKMQSGAALLFGSAFCFQSLLCQPLAGKLGLSRSRAVTGAVTSSLVANTVALLIIGLYGRAGAPASLMPLAQNILYLGILFVVAIFLLPRFSGLIFRKMQSDGTTEFFYVLFALFLMVSLSALAGLEPMLGAFLAGLALNSMVPAKSVLMDRVSFVGNSVFVPFFLISAGMLVDIPGIWAKPDSLFAIVVMVLAFFLLKFLAALALRIIKRYSWNEVILSFGLHSSQSAAILAVALVAHGLGLFPQIALSGSILIILISSIASPLLTKLGARRLALEERALPGEDMGGGERIMVMISNPERTRRLLDLAFILSGKDSQNPVYPVNVVQDSPDEAKDQAESERLLAQSVVHGVAKGTSVIPVTRVSFNVAEGVVQAARDMRASTIIAGAGPGSQFQKRPYGRIVDQIVHMSGQMVIVNRLPRAVNLYSSIIVVVPPLSDRQRGFHQAAGAIKTLANAISAKITLVTLAHAGAALCAEFERARPLSSFHRLLLDSWEDLVPQTKKISPSSSFYALLNLRQGSLAWQPAIDRIPSSLLEDNPAASILCLYLAEDQEEGTEEPSLPEDESLYARALREGRVLLWKEPRPMADAIRSLLATAFAEKRSLLTRLCASFMDIAQKEPVELKPGILLLHAHLSEVEEPAIFFGISATGIPLLNLQAPVRILLLLIAPEARPPEDHLRNLAMLAALVMDEGFAERLKNAKDQGDLEAAQGDKLG